MNATSGRMKVLRLLVSIPLAFGILAALGHIGLAGSCGDDWSFSLDNCGGAGGGSGDCTVTWTPYTSGYDSWTITEAMHQYESDLTITAKKTDSCDGHATTLLTQTAHSIGQEECEPLKPQTDWDKTEADPLTTPWTLIGLGGYTSSNCDFLGHYVTAEGNADLEDASVGVSQNGAFGFYHCYLIYPVAAGYYVPPGC